MRTLTFHLVAASVTVCRLDSSSRRQPLTVLSPGIPDERRAHGRGSGRLRPETSVTPVKPSDRLAIRHARERHGHGHAREGNLAPGAGDTGGTG
jgi:hypothetical protein